MACLRRRSILQLTSLVLLETVAMVFAQADPQVSSNPSSQTPPAPETPQLIHSEPQPGKGIIRLPNFFNKAANKGIYFHTFLNEELAANPYGGIRQGITASQYLTFGIGIELQRVRGWSGGALQALVIAVSRAGLSKHFIG